MAIKQITFRDIRVNAKGEAGSRVVVHLDGERFAFDTYGMTTERVAEKVQKIEADHQAIATKRAEYGAQVEGTDIEVGGQTFRIVDANFAFRGLDPWLYIQVKRVGVDGKVVEGPRGRVPGFPIERILSTASLPDPAMIYDEAFAELTVQFGGSPVVETAAIKENVKQLLGEEWEA